MMSESELDAFDAARYSSERLCVTGHPELGNVVEIEYSSNAGGAWRTSKPTTVRGELLYVEQFGTDDDTLTFVVHDASRDRAVSVRLQPDPITGNAVRSLAARKTKWGRRLGKVVSIAFTDEQVNTLAPPTVAFRNARPGDTVMVDGTEYGVVGVTEYGPVKQPSSVSAVLTRPDGSEVKLETSVWGGVTFAVRYGSELEIDPATVRLARTRERYYDRDNEHITPEDTTDAFPEPHGAVEGERLSFTLTGEDREDEQVSGEVTDVRYYVQREFRAFGDPEKKDPETAVELDDGRKVVLTNTGRRSHRWVTPSRLEHMDEHGMVRAFVVTRREDADNEYEHIEAVDIQPEDGGDGGGPATDGGRNYRGASDDEVREAVKRAERGDRLMTDGGEENPEVVISDCPENRNVCFHRVLSACEFHVSDSKRVPVNSAQAQGFRACELCDPPTYSPVSNADSDAEPATDGGTTPENLASAVSDALASSDIQMDAVSVSIDDVDPGVTVQGNAGTYREDWNGLRDDITEVLDANGFTYQAKPEWAFVEVTGREVRTDGGEDRHRTAMEKVIKADCVMMAKPTGDGGKYLAVFRCADAPENGLERYRTVMDLAGYTEVSGSVLDQQPGGVTGEDITLDVWKQRAMADGGESAVSISRLYTRVQRALAASGLAHRVDITPDRGGLTVSFTGVRLDTVVDVLGDAGVTGAGVEAISGVDATDISGKARVSGGTRGGDGE